MVISEGSILYLLLLLFLGMFLYGPRNNFLGLCNKKLKFKKGVLQCAWPLKMK